MGGTALGRPVLRTGGGRSLPGFIEEAGAAGVFDDVDTEVAEGLPSALRLSCLRLGKFHVHDADRPRVSHA